MNEPACKVFLEDALLMTIPDGIVPQLELPEGMTAIDVHPRRISLVSRRGMYRLLDAFRALDLDAFTPPTPIIGPPRLIARPGKEGTVEMACMVSRVENHEEISQFVKELFGAAGGENPEKRFVYHLTVANNAGGHPRGSIAYINRSDFNGEPAAIDRVFAQRELEGATLEAHARYHRPATARRSSP